MATESNDGLAEMRAALARMERRLVDMERRLTEVEKSTVVVTEVEAEPRVGREEHPARIPSTEPQVRVQSAPELYEIAQEKARTAATPPPPVQPPQPVQRPQPAVSKTVVPHPPRPASRAAGFAAKHATTPPAMTAARTESLETQIGRWWASLVGGLLVLGAVLFFLKLAWDKGWLHPTPEARIAMALALGAILVGLGEWACLKKIQALAASLAATGLATLMATFFAASVAFADPVIPRGVSFICVLIVGAAGIALSLHMRTIALTILALLGMYLSPAVLGSHQDKSLQLILYLGVVAVMGLGVSYFKRKWFPVRVLTLALTWLWVLGWATFGASAAHGLLGIGACGFFFAAFLAEMTASLVRVITTPATEAEPERASPNAMLLETGAGLLSFANTVAAMIAFAVVFKQSGTSGLWMVALGLAGWMGVAAFLTSSRIFSTAAAIQAMGLTTLAVPLYFNGSPITLAWGIMGLALAVYVYITDSRIARAWMVATMLLVVVRVCFFDIFDSGLTAELLTIGTQKITPWMLLGWGAGIYGLVLAWLTQERSITTDDGETLRRGALWAFSTLVALATFVWWVTCMLGLGAGFDHTLGLLVWSVGLMLFGRFSVPREQATSVDAPALVVLTMAAVKWLFYDGMVQSIGGIGGNAPEIPVLNLFVLNGLLLIAAPFAGRKIREAGITFVAWWIAAIGFVILNVESLRATDYWLSHMSLQIAGSSDPWIIKNVVISVLWGVVALAAIWVGFARNLSAVRWTAIVLLGATVLKVLVIDMSQVGTVMRVLSFMVVGVVLLLVSLVYSKVGRKLAASG